MTEKNQDLPLEEKEEVVEEIFAEEEQTEPTTSEEQQETSEIEVEIPQNDLEQKLLETEGRYVRLYADFENYRRRVKLDAEAAQKYRSQALVANLIPALDNFERALQTTSDNDETKALMQGMEMVYKSIIQALSEEGVEAIAAVGNEFDPHLHQAIMQDSNPEFGSNIVVEEFQKGYKLNDRVIRPSMVKVNQ